jgi:hypothetical protein
MNRFRKLGFIEYNGRIRVHKSLLNVVLHDQLSEAVLPGDLSEHNAERASLLGTPASRSKEAKQAVDSMSKNEQMRGPCYGMLESKLMD